MSHLFENFMTDASAYANAESYWLALWNSIPEFERMLDNWRTNWFTPQLPRDANPIFSAVSENQKKGIRIIQYEPTSGGMEFDCWLDTFGGPPTDPKAIRELVIACALSDDSARAACNAMSEWIRGEVEIIRYWFEYRSEAQSSTVARAA